MSRKISVFLCVLLLAIGAADLPVWAGGPLYVTGPSADHPGQSYRWALNPVPYQTDKGMLGNQTNDQANAMVSESFQIWHGAGTANIGFSNTGQLNVDITSSNIFSFLNGFSACSDTTQPVNPIIYDVNGSITAALGYDNNSTLGFSSAICSDDAAGVFTRGWAVLNGRFIDGQPNSSTHASVSVDVFKMVLTHEFGHLIGLDHSQINLNCYVESSCSAADMAGVPVMFPVLLDGATNVLRTDDIAALSAIYPAANFSSTTGRIRGRVLFSDGLTPAQGYNVIARLISDPRTTALSCVSGYLFTAGASNPFVPPSSNEEQFYGSQDQTLIGLYDIPGLPPGDYTIEVEAINNSGNIPFIEGSGVGPIGAYLGFQYKLPGSCDPQYLNYPSSPGDSCSAKSTVNAAAGGVTDTNTDVIFLGTPPRYDSWEDGP